MCSIPITGLWLFLPSFCMSIALESVVSLWLLKWQSVLYVLRSLTSCESNLLPREFICVRDGGYHNFCVWLATREFLVCCCSPHNSTLQLITWILYTYHGNILMQVYHCMLLVKVNKKTGVVLSYIDLLSSEAAKWIQQLVCSKN